MKSKNLERYKLIAAWLCVAVLIGLALAPKDAWTASSAKEKPESATPALDTKILVYGDSNARGTDGSGGQYSSEEQWPNLLSSKMDKPFSVKAEGLSARLAGTEYQNRAYLNGNQYFEEALLSARPVDYVVIALGTNDARIKGRTADTVYSDLLWYQQYIRGLKKRVTTDKVSEPVVVYLGIAENIMNRNDKGLTTKVKSIMDRLEGAGSPVIRLADLEHAVDGVHYSASDHRMIADLVYKEILELETAEK